MRIALIIFTFLFTFNASAQVIVGGDYNYPPYSYIDENGEPAGFDVDVIRAIEKKVDLNFEFRFAPWDSTLRMLERGEVDMVSGIVYTTNREEKYDFSFPLHTEYYAIFAHKSLTINDIYDLKGLVPGVLDGDIANEAFLKPSGLFENYVIAKSLPNALELVNKKACDYVIVPYPLGMGVKETNDLENIEIKGPPILPSVYCLAVAQGNSELLALLNKGINELNRSGELQIIYKKWVKYKRKDDKYRQFFLYALILLSALFVITVVLIAFWHSLKKQVNKKTKQIKETQEVYGKVFNSVDNGLIVCSANGIAVEANSRALKMLGFKYHELIKKSGYHFLKNSEKEFFSEVVLSLNNGNESKTIMKKKVGDNQHYFEIKGLNIEFQHKNLFLLVLTDITDQINSIDNLQKAKKEAESANRTKGVFLATISHEIKTPLNAILGFVDLLNRTNLDTIQHSYTRKLKIATAHLDNLVSDVLDLTKIEANKLRINNAPFSLKNTIEEIVEMEKIKAQDKNIMFVTQVEEHLPTHFLGDELRISQILLNLIGNAIKFSSNGEISFKVSRESDSPDNLNRVIVLFSIKDTGIGIPLEKQRKLFRAFEQLDSSMSRKYGGTGLGLTISKQLIELMSGEILIESNPGKGTVVNFSLPLKIHKGHVSVSRSKIKSETPPNTEDLKGCSILVVEDNLFNAEILLEQLLHRNADAIHASNGIEALELLNKNNFDLVLMDIEMPDMDGFETTQKIKELNNSIPIIALSAHDLTHEKNRALNAGMKDYIVKPVNFNHLTNIILKHIYPEKEDESALPAIKFEEGLYYFSGNQEQYIRALKRFYNSWLNMAAEIVKCHKENRDRLKTLTHNIKSASKMIGATQLHEIAANADHKLKNNTPPSEDEIVQLVQALNNVLNFIGNDLSSFQDQANAPLKP